MLLRRTLQPGEGRGQWVWSESICYMYISPGQSLLGINEDLAERYEAQVMEDSRLDRTHLRRYHEYSEREVLR